MKKKIVFQTKDFEVNDLPNTRRKQFADLFKNEILSLLKISLILVIFAIPFFASTITQNLVISNLSCELAEQGKTNIEISKLLIGTNSLFILFKCLSLIVFSIGLAGVARINKVLVFDQGLLFGRDFIQGIKENFKVYFVSSLIFSILLFFLEYLEMYLPLVMDARGAMPIIGISVGIIFGIFVGIFLVLSVESSIYSLSYFKAFVNAYRVLIRSFLWMLLFILLPLGLFLIKGISGFPIFVYLLLLLIIVIVLPVYLLGLHEFVVSRFDKLINQKYYPQIYLKGLYKKLSGNMSTTKNS